VRGLVGMPADGTAGGEGEVGMAAGWSDAHLEVEGGGKAEPVEQGGLGDAGVGGGGADRAGDVVEGVGHGF